MQLKCEISFTAIELPGRPFDNIDGKSDENV